MLLASVLLFLYLYSAVTTAKHHPTVYLIRHGEKPTNPNNHNLTLDGLRRAQCLRNVFAANSGYDIGHIMAPKMKTNGEHGRAFKTVWPVAQDLDLDVDTHCARKKAGCVADTIRTYSGPGNILVAWRHKNLVQIQKTLGLEYPLEYPEDRFDLIWTIPYPYKHVTDIQSEDCPRLDSRPGLVRQY